MLIALVFIYITGEERPKSEPVQPKVSADWLMSAVEGWVPANVSDVMALITADSGLLGVAPGMSIGALLGKGATWRTDTSGI